MNFLKKYKQILEKIQGKQLHFKKFDKVIKKANRAYARKIARYLCDRYDRTHGIIKLIEISVEMPYYGEEVLKIPYRFGKVETAVVNYLSHIKEGNYLRDVINFDLSSVKIKKVSGKNLIQCYNCKNLVRKCDSYGGYFYDTPFDVLPNDDARFCSQICEAGYKGEIYSKDFAYFTCCKCGRCICQQNPSNGWHVQYRMLNDCDMICLRCYEAHILENGIDIEKFEKRVIAGMFFSHGNLEAKDAGYIEVDGYVYTHLSSQESIERYCNKAIELINNGYKVINCYESLGIGGGEGYVTMMCKK